MAKLLAPMGNLFIVCLGLKNGLWQSFVVGGLNTAGVCLGLKNGLWQSRQSAGRTRTTVCLGLKNGLWQSEGRERVGRERFVSA